MTARCTYCEKPATCFGAYESAEGYAFGCDDHCGHGCEDGHCDPVEDVDFAALMRESVLRERAGEEQAEKAAASLAALRRDYALLVRAHLHPSDDYRMRVFREAMARVEGWGN